MLRTVTRSNRKIPKSFKVGTGSLTTILVRDSIGAMFPIGLVRSTLAGEVFRRDSNVQSFITNLVLLAFLASGYGKTKTAVPPSKTVQDTVQTLSAAPQLAIDSGSKGYEWSGPAVSDSTNVVEQQMSAGIRTHRWRRLRQRRWRMTFRCRTWILGYMTCSAVSTQQGTGPSSQDGH